MEFYFRMFWRCSKLLRSKRRHWKPSPLSIPQISWCVMNLKTAPEICSSGHYIRWWRRQFGNVSGYDNFNFQSIYSQSASEWIIKKCAEGAFEAQFDFQIFKQIWRHRSSRSNGPKVFCEKVVLTKFAIFTAKHMCWRLFLIKLQHTWRHATLLKRDSNTGVFLWILQNFLRASILKNICERLLLSKFR